MSVRAVVLGVLLLPCGCLDYGQAGTVDDMVAVGDAAEDLDVARDLGMDSDMPPIASPNLGGTATMYSGTGNLVIGIAQGSVGDLVLISVWSTSSALHPDLTTFTSLGTCSTTLDGVSLYYLFGHIRRESGQISYTIPFDGGGGEFMAGALAVDYSGVAQVSGTTTPSPITVMMNSTVSVGSAAGNQQGVVYAVLFGANDSTASGGQGQWQLYEPPLHNAADTVNLGTYDTVEDADFMPSPTLVSLSDIDTSLPTQLCYSVVTLEPQ